MQAAIEPDLAQVRLGSRLYQLYAEGEIGWRALDDRGEWQSFTLSHGGPLGFGVSQGSSAKARMIGVTWVTGCARAGRSPLPPVGTA